MRPLLVLEDTTRPRGRLFDLFGVEWWATGWAWAGPLFWVMLGWAVAWGADAGTGSGALHRITVGTAYGAFLWLAGVAHTLGHVAMSHLAGTPMDAVVVTSTRDVTVYRGAKRSVAERVRVVRSMGGPLANALLGSVALAAGLWTFGVFNLCIAAWTLAPVPTMDGWIVWRWVFSRGRTAP
jgi:Zn-dependent protease